MKTATVFSIVRGPFTASSRSIARRARFSSDSADARNLGTFGRSEKKAGGVLEAAPAFAAPAGGAFDLAAREGELQRGRLGRHCDRKVGEAPPEKLDHTAALGELALDGRLRGTRGTLSLAEAAWRAGAHTLICAADSST